MIRERGCELELHFDGRSGDAALLELRLRPAKAQRLDASKAREFLPRLGALHVVTISTASRWITEARRRGYLSEKDSKR